MVVRGRSVGSMSLCMIVIVVAVIRTFSRRLLACFGSGSACTTESFD